MTVYVGIVSVNELFFLVDSDSLQWPRQKQQRARLPPRVGFSACLAGL